MHHSKNFSNYPVQKKAWLIVALVGKFAVFGAVFTGLLFFLKDYTSTTMLLAISHLIVLAGLLAVFFIHKHKSRADEEECNCEVK
jgi:hypothetical protein